jgi:hypothetical protein
MTTKKVYYDLFLTHFSIKFSGPQTFFFKFEPLFLEKYQHLHKASLTQLSPFVEFYHWLKYLHNLQNHCMYVLPGIPDGSMRRYYSIDNNHTYLLLSKYMYIDNFNRH